MLIIRHLQAYSKKVTKSGEHVAYGVNSAFILLDHVREFLLIVIHFYSYFNDLHELDATS